MSNYKLCMNMCGITISIVGLIVAIGSPILLHQYVYNTITNETVTFNILPLEFMISLSCTGICLCVLGITMTELCKNNKSYVQIDNNTLNI